MKLKDPIRSGINGAVRILQSGMVFSVKLMAITLDLANGKKSINLPVRLRETFEELGATYIKLGQFIASAPSLFPKDYVEEMQKCLDSVRPVPFYEIKETIEEELGGSLSDFFRHVDEEPIASASIAQVHGATTRNGLDVVIKVQRKDIEDILGADMNLIYLATLLFNQISPGLSKSGIMDIVKDFYTSILMETDFIKEAENIELFDRHLQMTREDRARVPRVYHHLSTKKVLTMERLYGVPLTDIKSIKKYSDDPRQTLINALNIWFTSLGTTGVFHADVHAGNLMVLTDGKIGFIDFGIVGKISKEVWLGLLTFMEGIESNNAELMAKGLIAMDSTAKEIDERAFIRDLQRVFDEINSIAFNMQSGVGMIDEDRLNRVMLDLSEVSRNNGLKIPREFGLLIKQLLYFDRYVKALAPDIDLLRDQKMYIGQ
ncbi:MAG: AarF/ABC1/UbiB kinase family protein [Leptospiraceae bacterium]|nr:AarF/ABC1/UbiB kinase family protein [Leptospiraceae bacterium]